MRVTVLGCDASITGNRRTTCFQVDDDILIDAGTGAADLGLRQAAAIRDIFLTHAHLDHTCMLPLLADAAIGLREAPLNVHALPATLAALKRNLFNGEMWPDYTVQPTPDRPHIRLHPIEGGETVVLGGRKITSLPAKHAIPCTGYCVDSGESSWVYSGDTTLNEEFWQTLNRIPNLKHVLIETTFLDTNLAGAAHSGHMTARLLAQGLHMLKKPVEIHIVHMEAGREAETLNEILQVAAAYQPTPLQRGHIFTF